MEPKMHSSSFSFGYKKLQLLMAIINKISNLDEKLLNQGTTHLLRKIYIIARKFSLGYHLSYLPDKAQVLK